MEQWADRFVRKNGFEDVRADPEALDEAARLILTLTLTLTLNPNPDPNPNPNPNPNP